MKFDWIMFGLMVAEALLVFAACADRDRWKRKYAVQKEIAEVRDKRNEKLHSMLLSYRGDKR